MVSSTEPLPLSLIIKSIVEFGKDTSCAAINLLVAHCVGLTLEKESLPHICSIHRCGVGFLPFFSAIVLVRYSHPCLASVPFTGPFLLEMKFCRNFFSCKVPFVWFKVAY